MFLAVVDVNWSDYFIYDPTSPSGLRWSTVIYSGRGRRAMTIIGDIAGTATVGKRYYGLSLHGKHRKCHRIVWELHNGRIPHGLSIDHFDQNQFNNSIENLRVLTHKENCENRKISSCNTSGVTGVGFYSGACCAVWKEGGKTMSKKFALKRFGVMVAYRNAVLYRARMIKMLVDSGAKYTENHGK